MANISDYLKWRGDLTFKKSPFNYVDNLLISQLAYVDLENIVPSAVSREKISLCDASKRFFDLNDEEQLKKSRSFIRETPFLMRQMAESERFKDVVLCNYVAKTDEEHQMQFAAFHVRLPDNTVYVVFKGTDDSLVGWKEDFNMSFISPVPSQFAAVEYVNYTIHTGIGKIRMGGHSKGGNLAIYAAVNCASRVQRRIIEVYNNDGPGFDKNMVSSPLYRQMLPKIKTIVPHFSVVGMLLEHEEDYMVVKSSNSGIMQHDAMSWQVIGSEFETLPEVSTQSRVFNGAVSNWIDSMEPEKREMFVNTLFDIITSSGAKNLSDIYDKHFNMKGSLLKKYASLDKQTKKMLFRMLQSLTGEFDKAIKQEKG